MPSFFSTLLVLALSCALADAAALVPVPTVQLSLPVAGLEPNRGQAKAGILFLSAGGTSLAVTAQSVLYSPLGAVLSLVASNPNPTVSFADPLPGLVNSYTGANPQKWVTGIPRYATANLAAVYPGIDAQYTVAANGVLTLNLLLRAGIDPKTVTFQIAQATLITANSGGSLLVIVGPYNTLYYAPYASLSYAAPLAFQATASGQVSRSVSFAVQSTTQFGLAVQGLDATLPLQIFMQLDGVVSEQVFSGYGNSQRASDAAGNTFFATQVVDAAGKDAPFPTIAGVGCDVTLSIPMPCSDVAVYKYSAAGVLDFVTYLAGRTRDLAGFVGLAADGAVVVAGTTDSSDFPVTAAALQPVYAGPPAEPGGGGEPVGGNLFAARLDSSTGELLSSTFFGGPNGASMGGAALGADGSLYFLPALYPAEMPVTNGALQASCPENPCLNSYAARLSPALDKLIYGTYVPGYVDAAPQVYADGSVYYAGDAGPGFPTTPGAYQTQNAGGRDGIVARLDPTGSSLLFATYIGTPETDQIYNIAVAPDGSVWAAVTSFAECCPTNSTRLVHLDAHGTRLLADLPIEASQMVVDTAGNLFALAAGSFTVSPGAFLTNGGCNAGAYIELSPSGQQLFATYLPSNLLGFDGADAQGTPYLDTSTGGRVQVVENQPTGPFAGCVVDAAGFSNQGTTSPGAIVTIFGSGLGPSQGIGFELANGELPTSLGGTEVLVNGEPAPLLYSSDGQLNVILPYSLPVGTMATIQVVSAGTPTNQLADSVVEQGISFFSVGNGSAAALNQDGTLNSPQNPAQPGSTVALFATGGGQTVPPSVAGEVTPLVLRPLANTPILMIGYVAQLTVEWAGAAPGLVSGVTQVNITLPDAIPVVAGFPAGTLPVWVVEGFSSGSVTISVAVN
jgi:uncharacterized protein (TIGR03437 family)